MSSGAYWKWSEMRHASTPTPPPSVCGTCGSVLTVGFARTGDTSIPVFECCDTRSVLDDRTPAHTKPTYPKSSARSSQRPHCSNSKAAVAVDTRYFYTPTH